MVDTNQQTTCLAKNISFNPHSIGKVDSGCTWIKTTPYTSSFCGTVETKLAPVN